MVHAGFGKVRGAPPVTCRALGQSTGLVEPVFSFRWHAPFYRRSRGIIPHVAAAWVHVLAWNCARRSRFGLCGFSCRRPAGVDQGGGG